MFESQVRAGEILLTHGNGNFLATGLILKPCPSERNINNALEQKFSSHGINFEKRFVFFIDRRTALPQRF